MKLTFEEKVAIKSSLRHWIEDIYMPLCIPGMTVSKISPIFSVVESLFIERRQFNLMGQDLGIIQLVSDMGSDCPLCQYSKVDATNFNRADEDEKFPKFLYFVCDHCPYKEKHYIPCYFPGGHWELWVDNPCLQTAIDMITALENLLPESERDGVYR